MRRSIAAVLLATLVVTSAGAASAKSVKLAYAYKDGQIDRYRLLMDMKISMPQLAAQVPQPMRINVSMLLTQKVLEVLPDGSTKLRVSVSDAKVIAPHMPQTADRQMPEQSMTMTVSPSGRLLAVDDLQMAGTTATPGRDLIGLPGQIGYYGAFPEVPVAVGQSWRSAVPLPFGSGDMIVESTLLAAALPMGKDVVSKIKQSYQAYTDLGEMMNGIPGGAQMNWLSGPVQMTGWTVLYFSPSQGKLLKADGSIQMDMTLTMPADAVQQGAPAQLNMQADMALNVKKI